MPEARRLHTVSFEEMLEMASLGSKVLQIRSVEFAGKYRVPLRVLSSFTPWDINIDEEARSRAPLITFEEDVNMEQAVISGIAFNRDEAKITVMGVPDRPGIAYQILGEVADANIDVDVIIQNVSHEGKTDFSFTVHRNDYARTMGPAQEQGGPGDGRWPRCWATPGICKVSIVSIGMLQPCRRGLEDVPHAERGGHQHHDDHHQRDQDVGRHRRRSRMELAVRALHEAFDLEEPVASEAS